MKREPYLQLAYGGPGVPDDGTFFRVYELSIRRAVAHPLEIKQQRQFHWGRLLTVTG